MCGILSKIFLPLPHLIPQPGQTGRGGNGQTMCESAGDRDSLVNVGDIGQRATSGPFQEHGEACVIALVQCYCPSPTPDGEGVRLMDIAGVRKRELQNSQ
ncbi:hypothetical protein SPAR_41889 [Streptomyces sparsogenes DSM 40356]|uniref:Uncharacterized protein n=1 Tax=Streptomyces sparsogenes DSM 40356 TaxID=1331668 RepID=A0A1R1S4V1_9ACTN|nr:hypothetical protein SPAR_41889 [Streptomyces sparsogenes DSM 40356]